MTRRLLLGLLVLFVLAPSTASAAKDEMSFFIKPQYMFLPEGSNETGHKHGVGAELGWWYAVRDDMNIIVAANYGFHLKESGKMHTADLQLLGAYTIDAVKWVVSFPVGIGGRFYTRIPAGRKNKFDILLIAGAAVDYRPSRTFSVGLDLRITFNLAQFTTFPVAIVPGIRFNFYWEK